MTAPYQLPGDLLSQPLGVSWASIGQSSSTRPSPALNQASLDNICWQASNQAETEAGQPLRATVQTETLSGPSHRLGILPSGVARFTTSQGPVLKVTRVQVHVAAAFPYTNWTTLPRTHAYPEEEAYGLYNSTAPGMATAGGFAIYIDGTYVNWLLGPKGTRVQVTYVAGFPHTQLTTKVTAGATTLQVDDVTGWAGAVGWISDATKTEVVQCLAVTQGPAPAWSASRNYPTGMYVSHTGVNYQCVQMNGPGTVSGPIVPSSTTSTAWMATPEPSGPGTLTLFNPVQSEHTAPVLVTTMPPTLRWAVALLAKAQGLQRGVATLVIGSNNVDAAGGVDGAIQSALQEASLNVLPYRRPW